MVKLNKITKDLDCLVLAKVETFNPGNSVKDRMAVKMIEDAATDGRFEVGGYYSGRNFRKYWNGIGIGSNSKRL